MKSIKLKKIITILSIVIMVLSQTMMITYGEISNRNRFNIVIVTDASGSMKGTDPDGLRFEAINQFVHLLAEKGNYLGAVVFSDTVVAKEEIIQVNDLISKDKVMNTIKSVVPSNDTNIGEALMVAVDMLEANQNPDLPSTILFLSDGNTDLNTEEALTQSLDQKAEAIQRAREKGISIYSICLNANQKADVTEMQQISSATGGSFQEVGKASDLENVFHSFYDLIYGTASQIDEEVFPESGVLEKEFDVPGLGVEEVNIVVSGKTNAMSVQKPDGSDAGIVPVVSDTFTILKITDVIPGTWKLITQGIAGDQIKINMVYNTDLEVELKSSALNMVTNPADEIALEAYVKAGETKADASNIKSYEAEMIVLDAYGEEQERIPMSIAGDHFEVKHLFKEGNYYCKALVKSKYLEKTSESIGPLQVSANVLSEEEKNNTPPEAVKEKIEKTVYIIPFRKSNLDIPLKDLAKDAQDKELVYKIVSSSFIENEDYTLKENTIVMEKYSLSKGAFDIQAIDKQGLSCNIEIIIKAINVGLITTIVIGIIAMIVLIIFISLFIILINKPFGGKITVVFHQSGIPNTVTLTGKRGRLPLKEFSVNSVELPYQKAYFQATGRRHIYLIFPKNVYSGGRQLKKIKISHGGMVMVQAAANSMDRLEIRFESILKTKK